MITIFPEFQHAVMIAEKADHAVLSTNTFRDTADIVALRSSLEFSDQIQFGPFAARTCRYFGRMTLTGRRQRGKAKTL